ncbi:MAG: molybdate ABC transporter permease subunit [Verrucomicrobiales bacterium]|nr:molybdate ABC transporter permease subunit [Verrucomicrobiales bacterium]
MDWSAISLSLRLSACTTLILVVLGLPLAWWLSNTRSRARCLIEAVVALPLVLPPTVLGFYVLMAIGPHSPLGQAYEAVFGTRLPFSFQGLLVASVIYSLPFAVQPFMGAFATVDRRFIEASWCLGVRPLETFLRVVLPLAWPGVLAGIVLTFAHTMGEFGVVLMVGGNLPGTTRTVAVSIYDHVQALDYAAAHQTALAMLVFSFLVLSITYALQRRFTQTWPIR